MNKGKITTIGVFLYPVILFGLSSPAMGQGTTDLPQIDVPVGTPDTTGDADAAGAGQAIPIPDFTIYVDPVSKSALSNDPASNPASVTVIKYDETTTRNLRGYEDLLKPITGVVSNNFDQGSGVGFGFVLRGFGERFNGSQVGLYVDGVPINQPGHQLSNGYGDLFPLIPELIETFTLTRGPFDVRAGAFAVSGSAFYTTADAPSSGVIAEGGDHDLARGLGVYNFGAGNVRGYGSLVVETTDGYRDNTGWDQYNTFNKVNFPMLNGTSSLSFQLQETEFDSPGFINRDLIQAGVINEKEARNPTDGGDTVYQSIVFNWEQDSDQPLTANAYVLHTDLSRFASFAGNTTIPVPGDTPGIQRVQEDDRVETGGTVEKYARWEVAHGVGYDLLVGAGVKADFVNQDEFDTTARQKLSRREDLDFTIVNPFGYFQSNISFFEFLKLTGGLRYDQMYYDIEGFANPAVLAANTPVDISPSIYAYQPKFGATVTPIKGLDFFANYGEGFRPPSANGTQFPNDPNLEQATLESKEVGVQYNSPNGVLHVLASTYDTDFTNELQGQGQTIPPISLGPSIRTGFDIEGRVRVYSTRRARLSFYGGYSEQNGELTEPLTPGGTHVPDIAEFLVKYGVDLTVPVGGKDSPHILNVIAGQVWEGPRALVTTNKLTSDTFSRVDARVAYTNEDLNGFSAFVGVIAYPDGRLDETALRFGGDQVGVSAKSPLTVQGGVFIPLGRAS